MNRNDPWLHKNVFWVRQRAVVKGHFTYMPDRPQGRYFFAFSPPRPSADRLLDHMMRQTKNGQPIGRPTWTSYQIFFPVSISIVFVWCKSVFCTNTFYLFYTILHLENCIFSWYLIDTKRWYQCTGKLQISRNENMNSYLEIRTIFFEENQHTARVRKT